MSLERDLEPEIAISARITLPTHFGLVLLDFAGGVTIYVGIFLEGHMDISSKSLVAGIATGAVGIWLTILFFQNERADYVVQEARSFCDKARFDYQFAKTT